MGEDRRGGDQLASGNLAERFSIEEGRARLVQGIDSILFFLLPSKDIPLQVGVGSHDCADVDCRSGLG